MNLIFWVWLGFPISIIWDVKGWEYKDLISWKIRNLKYHDLRGILGCFFVIHSFCKLLLCELLTNFPSTTFRKAKRKKKKKWFAWMGTPYLMFMLEFSDHVHAWLSSIITIWYGHIRTCDTIKVICYENMDH